MFANLEQKGRLKDEDSKFLQECFHYMQRKDLIRKLGGDPQDLERKIKTDGPSMLSEFRYCKYTYFYYLKIFICYIHKGCIKK